MKNRFYKLTTIFFAIVLVGCSSDDKVIDEVNAGLENGAFLRVSDIQGSTLALGNSDATFSVTVEYSDENLTDELLDRVDFTISFIDNNAPDDSAGPAAIGSLAKSDFSTSEFGLPKATFSYTFGEALAALGLSESQIMGFDQFNLRWEVFLTDGRSYTVEDANGNVTALGGFYSSPYQALATVVCPPIAPTAGVWMLELQDSYGDSWNGASLSVTIDGTTTDYTHDGGASTSHTVTVPDGTASLQIVYNAGSFDEENTFQVISANGMTVLDLGPEPPTGIVLFDFCMPLVL